MNKTFTDGKKPLVAMIQCRTADECIDKIRRSADDGAEAFGIQLCQLKIEERTDENLKSIFDACNDKPVYITSYRYNESTGMTDEECAELLVKGLSLGATLCDIPGDLFDQNEFQITENQNAVDRQRELIDKIHKNGGEVLISTHDLRELPPERIYEIAQLQAMHGADVIKIVVRSESVNVLPEYIKVVQKVNETIRKPFLFLDIGACSNILRKVGPDLGTCMYLCVQSHGALDTPAQPVLKKLKLIKENMMEAENGIC